MKIIENIKSATGELSRAVVAIANHQTKLEGHISALAGSVAQVNKSVNDLSTFVDTQFKTHHKFIEQKVNEIKAHVHDAKVELADILSYLRSDVSARFDSLGQSMTNSFNSIHAEMESGNKKIIEGINSATREITKNVERARDAIVNENRENFEKTVLKLAEIAYITAKLHASSQRDFAELIGLTRGIKTSIDQVAEGTISAVREELRRQTKSLEQWAERLEDRFNSSSAAVIRSLNETREGVTKALEEIRNFINNRVEEFKKILDSSTYNVAYAVAYLENLKTDINKALDALEIAVTNCYTDIYIRSR